MIIINGVNFLWGSNYWCPGRDKEEAWVLENARIRGIKILVKGPRGGWYGRKPDLEGNNERYFTKEQVGAVTYFL